MRIGPRCTPDARSVAGLCTCRSCCRRCKTRSRGKSRRIKKHRYKKIKTINAVTREWDGHTLCDVAARIPLSPLRYQLEQRGKDASSNHGNAVSNVSAIGRGSGSLGGRSAGSVLPTSRSLRARSGSGWGGRARGLANLELRWVEGTAFAQDVGLALILSPLATRVGRDT